MPPPLSVLAADDICSLQNKVVCRTKSALRLTGCHFVSFQSRRLHGHSPPPCYLAFTIYDLGPLSMALSSIPKNRGFYQTLD